MNRFITRLIPSGLILLAFTGAIAAGDSGSNDARLREALRNALLQARTAENERAVLEASNADLKEREDTLSKRVEAITQQSRSDKAAADKAIADLKTRLAERTSAEAQLKRDLEKSRGETQAALAESQAWEAARTKIASENIVLQRTVSDQKSRNGALYRLGIEILDRYEKFGFGEALGAREPFVGTTRVKLENLVQDYQDKLSEQRIKTPSSRQADAARTQ